MQPNLSTSGALLHPSPQNHLPTRDTSPGARKRSADDNLDVRPAQRPSPPAVTQPNGILGGVPRESTPQPRKVLAPGATQAAIARLAELKAQGEMGSAPAPRPPPANPSPMPAVPAVPSGKKVPAPGATQAAMARLASRGSASNIASSGSLSQPSPPVHAPPFRPSSSPAAAVFNGNGSAGPKKVLAPGATQAAMARLATLKTAGSGSVPAQMSAPAPATATAMPPSSRPLSSQTDFSLGTIVWAKMQSYPWWPAQVQRPSAEQARLRHSSTDIFIVFYGTADYTWLPQSDLRPFRINLPEYGRFAGSKNKGLQRAIDDAWVSLGQPRPDVLGKVPVRL